VSTIKKWILILNIACTHASISKTNVDGFHRILIQYHSEVQESLKQSQLLCIWGSELNSLAQRKETAENLKKI